MGRRDTRSRATATDPPTLITALPWGQGTIADMTDRESRDQPAVSTGQPVIGVLRRPDEIMLDLDSPDDDPGPTPHDAACERQGVDAGDSEARWPWAECGI